jgi:hypothetical protein
LLDFFGTFLPFLRASESPMAIACFRLFTVLPLRPLFSTLLSVGVHFDRRDDAYVNNANIWPRAQNGKTSLQAFVDRFAALLARLFFARAAAA